ncbi:hypothetical protein B0H14DRAFT_1158730 [Mycena olivaceomarginata]|nr:hypothetical protein B0H14DRAFT_1158730 [Mycena olivaceomarginata]
MRSARGLNERLERDADNRRTEMREIGSMIRESQLAQLATLDQQREFVRYSRGLTEWLERDIHDRQAELRGVVARVDQIREDMRWFLSQGAPGSPDGGASSSSDENDGPRIFSPQYHDSSAQYGHPRKSPAPPTNWMEQGLRSPLPGPLPEARRPFSPPNIPVRGGRTGLSKPYEVPLPPSPGSQSGSWDNVARSPVPPVTESYGSWPTGEIMPMGLTTEIWREPYDGPVPSTPSNPGQLLPGPQPSPTGASAQGVDQIDTGEEMKKA